MELPYPNPTSTEVSRAYDQDKWQFPAEGALNVTTLKVIDLALNTEFKEIHCLYYGHISVIKICVDCEVTERTFSQRLSSTSKSNKVVDNFKLRALSTTLTQDSTQV